MAQAEQPDTREPEAQAPRPPIIVLGKTRIYMTASSTLEEAIKRTQEDLAMEGKAFKLYLHELEFFDAAGRQLAPTGDSGTLSGLEIKVSHQDEIRDRLRRIFHEVEPAFWQEQHKDRKLDITPLTLPYEPDFGVLVQGLAEAFAPDSALGLLIHELAWV